MQQKLGKNSNPNSKSSRRNSRRSANSKLRSSTNTICAWIKIRPRWTNTPKWWEISRQSKMKSRKPNPWINDPRENADQLMEKQQVEKVVNPPVQLINQQYKKVDL